MKDLLSGKFRSVSECTAIIGNADCGSSQPRSISPSVKAIAIKATGPAQFVVVPFTVKRSVHRMQI